MTENPISLLAVRYSNASFYVDSQWVEINYQPALLISYLHFLLYSHETLQHKIEEIIVYLQNTVTKAKI